MLPLAFYEKYARISISDLSPDIHNVRFSGIVTNITHERADSQTEQDANEYVNLLLTDGVAEILVKVSNVRVKSNFLLGQRLEVSTTHILSTLTPGTLDDYVQNPAASFTTTISPKKDMGCTIKVLSPTEYQIRAPTRNLNIGTIIPLRDFLRGTSTTLPGTQILAVVLNIERKETVSSRLNTIVDSVELEIVDHSSLHQTLSTTSITPAYLSLDFPLLTPVSTFTPRRTVLLISHPELLSTAHNHIKLTPRSQIFINPSTHDTHILRNWVNRLHPIPPATTRSNSSQNCTCTARLTNIRSKQAQTQLPRKQYTLALFLEEISLRRQHHNLKPAWRRHLRSELTFVGYTSVIITKVNLAKLHQRGQLFCSTCLECRTELFSNSPTVEHICAQRAAGSVTTALSWNSNILSGFSDETAGVTLRGEDERHDLRLTDQAVLGLTGQKRSDFGHSSRSLMQVGANLQIQRRLARIEAEMLWCRATLVLGWTACDCPIDGYSGRVKDRVGGGCGGEGQDRIVVLDVMS